MAAQLNYYELDELRAECIDALTDEYTCTEFNDCINDEEELKQFILLNHDELSGIFTLLHKLINDADERLDYANSLARCVRDQTYQYYERKARQQAESEVSAMEPVELDQKCLSLNVRRIGRPQQVVTYG